MTSTLFTMFLKIPAQWLSTLINIVVLFPSYQMHCYDQMQLLAIGSVCVYIYHAIILIVFDIYIVLVITCHFCCNAFRNLFKITLLGATVNVYYQM